MIVRHIALLTRLLYFEVGQKSPRLCLGNISPHLYQSNCHLQMSPSLASESLKAECLKRISLVDLLGVPIAMDASPMPSQRAGRCEVMFEEALH